MSSHGSHFLTSTVDNFVTSRIYVDKMVGVMTKLAPTSRMVPALDLDATLEKIGLKATNTPDKEIQHVTRISTTGWSPQAILRLMLTKKPRRS